jgi:tRNA 2-thiouridine synthesizing protein E
MIENLLKTNELTIKLNDEGYLTNFEQWNIEVGELIAKKHNIELTATHWDILSWIQEQFKAKKKLTIEEIIGTKITDIKGLKNLFTDEPLSVSTKIAGIPKPKNCL